jgi:hypothetical protein
MDTKNSKIMKMKKLLGSYTIIAAALFLGGCEEIERGPLSSDTEPPKPIANLVVTNEPGGATIHYDLPSETDLLYVKAEYTLSDGKQYEVRSSIYLNSVKVEGYGDTDEHTVTLHAVDRSGNTSAPISVQITPETPAVHSVLETVEMIPDFGGVNYSWKNEGNAALSYIILAEDSLGDLYPIETLYSSVTEGNYSLRGFDPEENQIFGIILRDRWDNFSDTLKLPLTPMYEGKLDKNTFNRIVLPGDTNMDAWGAVYEDAYDDDLSNFNHSYAGTGWPQYFTLDLGVTAHLSRFVVHQRVAFKYSHGNPRLLEIWGIAEEPPADGSWDGWVKLKDCVAKKPSQDGGTAAEDEAHLKAGDEYSFNLQVPPVRYIRILVNETWGNTGFIHVGELTFYGQVN